MYRSLLAAAAMLAVAAACQDAPTEVPAFPEDDALPAEGVAPASADVMPLLNLAEDEFLRGIVGSVEDEALARGLTAALRDIERAARTRDRAAVMRVLAGGPVHAVREGATALTPHDELMLSVVEITLAHAGWWIATAEAGQPMGEATLNGPDRKNPEREIER